MEINECLNNFWAVSADRSENIALPDVKKLLTSQNIKWRGATTKWRVSKGPMFCTWTIPEEESIIRVDFGQTEHPYLALLFTKALNDLGYTCIITENGGNKEKFVFHRPEFFTEDELRRMMRTE